MAKHYDDDEAEEVDEEEAELEELEEEEEEPDEEEEEEEEEEDRGRKRKYKVCLLRLCFFHIIPYICDAKFTVEFQFCWYKTPFVASLCMSALFLALGKFPWFPDRLVPISPVCEM